MTSSQNQYPRDFNECVRFHGHVCPGLAIGYAATKIGMSILRVGPARDEEIVAIVENDSCAVDAVQVVVGCTFGKGNLIFRDWGKQVFTFMDRNTGNGVRVSLKGDIPGQPERHKLRAKIESGLASEAEKKRWTDLRDIMTEELVSSNLEHYFDVREISREIPPPARVVQTVPCPICGESVMATRLLEQNGRHICHECATIPPHFQE